MSIGLKGNADGSGAIQVNGTTAITIASNLDVTCAGNVAATGTLTGATGVVYPLISATAQVAAGINSLTFTGVPSWAKRITISYLNQTTSFSEIPLVRIGAGSASSTGYSGYVSQAQGATSSSNSSVGSGFPLTVTHLSTYTTFGSMVLTKVSGNTWVSATSYGGFNTSGSAPLAGMGGGAKALTGTLDRVIITTGPSVTFNGTYNIFYE